MTGIPPAVGLKTSPKFDWDDLYQQTLARTKITASSPEKMY
jgi:hypothetical protein